MASLKVPKANRKATNKRNEIYLVAARLLSCYSTHIYRIIYIFWWTQQQLLHTTILSYHMSLSVHGYSIYHVGYYPKDSLIFASELSII